MTGQKMRSYISPAAEYSLSTLELLRKHSIEFGGDGMDDDVPYYMQVDGEATDFVQIPLCWTLDDAPLYWFNLLPPLFFGGPYAESSRACYHLCMHPFLSGRRARVKTIERVIQYILLHQGVRFCTLAEVNDMFRAVVPPGTGEPGMWNAVEGEPRRPRKVDGVPILM